MDLDEQNSMDMGEAEEVEGDVLGDMINKEILDGEDSTQYMDQHYMKDDSQMKEDDEDETAPSLKRAASESPSDEEPANKKRTNEVDKLWKNVNENPSDFQAWTLLLQHIDQVVSNGEDSMSDLDSGREAYDGFFGRYPYCYGYWKKYADLERRKGTKETAMKVFNRGLEAIPLSVDLWLHYMEYITQHHPDDEALVRQEFERAVQTCGLEFKSDKLWEAYITWETAGKRWKNVTQLYERLIGTPTSKYMQHWQKFQEHVKKHLPSEVVGVDEFLSVRRTVLAELNRLDTETPDEAPPGVEAAPGDDTGGTNVQDEETKALQKNIISARQKTHEANVAEAKALWSYEDAIKRPYFHVKPLEKSQLMAWRNYLDYEIKQGKDNRIRVLFERCLIACALYEEFWMRYVRYLEESGAADDEVRAVYNRACLIHLREKIKPHLSWAVFEEERGEAGRALEILEEVLGRAPSSLEAWMQMVGLERRRDNLDEARDTFEKCLTALKEKEDKTPHSQISLKYARFHTIFNGDPEKALEILWEAHEVDKCSTQVMLAIVDQALSCRPPKFDVAVDAMKAGFDASQPAQTRMMFAHRYYHFMTECGRESDSQSQGLKVLREVQQEVRQMDMSAEGDPTAKQDNMGIAVVEMRREKKNAMEKAGSSPVNGTTTNSQQQQTQQQQQQQAQSGNPNYQNYQQAGYGGYGQGYGQGYGVAGYQNWYPAQQGSYGYGQQGWGTYGNYYGQR